MSLSGWIRRVLRGKSTRASPCGQKHLSANDNDSSVCLPPGSSAAEVVEHILEAQKVYQGHDAYVVRSLVNKFGLNAREAELAVVRVDAGRRQAEGRFSARPDKAQDSIGWAAYERFGGVQRERARRYFSGLRIPWRLLRWAAITAGVGFAGTTAKLWIYRIQADQAVQQEIARLNAVDPGWTFEEIDGKSRKLAAEENGALLVQEIAQLIPEDWPIWDQRNERKWDFFRQRDPKEERLFRERKRIAEEIDRIGFRESLSPSAKKALNAELARVEQPLAMAEDLIKYRDGHNPVTYLVVWPRTSVTHLVNTRKVALLLAAQSSKRTQDGDADAACESALRVLHAGRSLGGRETMIPHLARVALMNIAVASTERALAAGEANAKILRQLQELFEQEDSEQLGLMLHSARLERALTHRMQQALAVGEITLKDMDMRFEGESWWDRFALHFGLAPLRLQHASFLHETTEEIEKWKKPWPPEGPPLPGRTDENQGKWYRTYVNGMEKFKYVLPRTQAMMRSAALAMAIERFRLDKGAWPNDLEELAPAYINKVPRDPYGDGPMRLVRMEDSVVIYSVWKDAQDNGGILERDFAGAEGTDIGFQLWDRTQRQLRGRSVP